MNKWTNEWMNLFWGWLMPTCLAWILVGPGFASLTHMQLTSDVLALLRNINIYNCNYSNSDEFLLRKFALEWLLSYLNSFFNAIQWCSSPKANFGHFHFSEIVFSGTNHFQVNFYSDALIHASVSLSVSYFSNYNFASDISLASGCSLNSSGTF